MQFVEAAGWFAGSTSPECAEDETLLPTTSHVSLDWHHDEPGITGLFVVFSRGGAFAISGMEESSATDVLHSWVVYESDIVAIPPGLGPVEAQLYRDGALVGSTRAWPVH